MPDTVGSLLDHAYRSLAAGRTDDPRTESEWLLESLLQLTRSELYLNRSLPVQADFAGRLQVMLERRRGGEPVQYIVGSVPFLGCTLTVTPAVLIPRPETELLAEKALAYVHPPAEVLDIGTGSGALAVAVAAGCPGCRVTALDVSVGALAVARGNARANGVEGRVVFLQRDIREPAAEEGPYDVIVTNPPYIPSGDIATLQDGVRLFEPHLALDGGPDGLAFYRLLADRAGTMLKPGGTLLAEVGAGQAPEVIGLFNGNPAVAGCVSERDYAGIERIVIARRKEN